VTNEECLESHGRFRAVPVLDAQSRLAFVEQIVLVGLALVVAATIAGFVVHIVVDRSGGGGGGGRVELPQADSRVVAAGSQKESAIVIGIFIASPLLTVPKGEAGDPIEMSR
jgi:uncharacterized membrane protein